MKFRAVIADLMIMKDFGNELYFGYIGNGFALFMEHASSLASWTFDGCQTPLTSRTYSMANVH